MMNRRGRLHHLFLIMMTVFFSVTPVFTQRVDEDELKKSNKIDFQNFKGRYKEINTVQEIRGMGSALAAGAEKSGFNTVFSYQGKYSVVRVFDKQGGGLLSADIISIDKSARIDSVVNIRRIISGYLTTAYGYSAEEADTLALYATYYNAVYRGNTKYFFSRYIPAVKKYINARNAGLATRYYQWPGATKIVIPVTHSGDKRVDPFAISDDKTGKEVKKEDKDSSTKKKLIEIKKDDIDKDKKEIEKKKKELADKERKTQADKKRTEDEKKQLEEKKKKLADEKKRLQQEKKKAEEIKDPVKRKQREDEIKKEEKKLEEKKEEIKKEEREIKKEDETLKKKEEETSAQKEDIKKKEETVAEKEKIVKKEEREIKKETGTETTADREDAVKEKEKQLAKKEQELDKREDKIKEKEPENKVFAEKLFYLKIKDYAPNGHYNNEMYMINPATRKVEFVSKVKNICGSRYDVFSEGIVVITHLGNHAQGHRLTILDRETLDAKQDGTDNIFWRSFIVIRDNFIFVIVDDGEIYYLAKFDANLKMVAKSKERINENTFIGFYENYIYINRHNRDIIVLSKEDLSFIDEIKP
jgi:hypothetical protein